MRQLLALWRHLRGAAVAGVEDAGALLDRARAHVQAGDSAAAERCCEQAVANAPEHGEAWLLLAALRCESKHLDEARFALARASATILDERQHPSPDRLAAAAGIAVALDELDGATRLLERVDAAAPAAASAWMRLGEARLRRGDLARAGEAFERTLRIAPDQHAAANELGRIRLASGDLDGAAGCFRRTVEIEPGFHGGHVNLGSALLAQGRIGPAIDAYREALRLAPDDADTLNNLANALKDSGEIEAAIHCYREALDRAPAFAEARSNLLFALQYSSSVSAEERFDEHRDWARRHEPSAPAPPFPHDADPERRLRIGYVSSDFRAHSVAHFIEPVLRAHDASRCEVYLYSTSVSTDAVTERLRGLVDGRWRGLQGLNTDEALRRIRDDRIDILVDLNGHTAGNRLELFAGKPAPVQMTWLGYPDTTGLRAVDYRLVDAWTDPQGASEACHSETLLRLDGGFLCFQSPADSPPPAPPPMLTSGAATFGSFNTLGKLNDEVVALWSTILRAVPKSRLLMKTLQFRDEALQDRVRERFRAHGVAERIDFAGWLESPHDHLALYARVDVALDPFPYNGTTTTCEALWMGVPVVTLAGEAHAGRVGVSLLNQVGHPELVAATRDDYQAIAASLAGDPGRLRSLRDGLRADMAASRLVDAPGFTATLEAAFRDRWADWCRARTQP